MSNSRRDFIKKAGLLGASMYTGTHAFSVSSYRRIIGANDRINIGVIGFSDRHKGAHAPSFLAAYKDLNFDIIAVSDIWKLRREEGVEFWKQKLGHSIKPCLNNESLYDIKDIDAVFVSTSDFQHALHAIEAVDAGKDAYVEKPLAETMEDARAVLKAVKDSKKIVQIGSQRRSGVNYFAANDFIKSGKFGDIVMVELTWNVNQPGRWRRPDLVAKLKEEDTDWKRFLLNRPDVPFNARHYLEYRLFWPYSSGIPGQWMAHQIDTVHWFSGLDAPRNVVANGGIYTWKDGRTNVDTFSAAFEYGPFDDKSKGFQVIYSSRFNNEAGGVKEYYYSNGGMINLDTNKITSEGGLKEKDAKGMGLQANLLPEMSLKTGDKIATDANTGADPMTSLHMRNWMDCIRSRKESNAPARVGFNHSVANIMATEALHTGKRVSWDPKKREIILS